MGMEEFVYTDTESLYSKLKHQHKQLSLKRRWLMGLPLSDSEQRRVNRGGILRDKKTLPESFLREDDVHYETVKAFIRKGFGAMNGEREYQIIQDNIWTFDFPHDIRKVISVLDKMSNNGLLLVAKLLTGGSLKFGKTRWKMKKIIKEHIPEVLKNLEDGNDKMKVEKLYKILINPQNFNVDISKFSSRAPQTLYASALKILDGLEDMDSLTLSAMHRKLRGIRDYIPQLQPKKSGWTRSALIAKVRTMCMQMLSELGENNELQEPLVNAMAVATLSSNLIQGSPSPVDFKRFSSEIMALQNEIAKAIRLLDGNAVRFRELNNVQMFVDKNSELSSRSLRTAVKNLLVEFLFECSDLDTIPLFLFEILSIVNRTSRSAPYRFFSEEEIEEEVENVLCMSAQMKQILWDLLPEFEYDHDFADAYMEDLEDSDDGDHSDDSIDDAQGTVSEKGYTSGSNKGYDQIEATGETSPMYLDDFSFKVEPHITESNLMDSSPFSTPFCFQIDSFDNMEEDELNKGNLMESESSEPQMRTNGSTSSSHLQLAERSKRNHDERQEYILNPEKPTDLFSSSFKDRFCTNRNHYLDVQEACDRTSLVAYQLIGCLLQGFAEIESLDFDCADASYLRGESSSCNFARAAKEENIPYEEGSHGSVIVQVLEELLPSFPESGKDKVKELMGLK